jgi:hypothetical protein
MVRDIKSRGCKKEAHRPKADGVKHQLQPGKDLSNVAFPPRTHLKGIDGRAFALHLRGADYGYTIVWPIQHVHHSVRIPSPHSAGQDRPNDICHFRSPPFPSR